MEHETILRLLARAEKARRRAMQPHFTRLGLAFGQGQARILEELLTRDHVTQKELADRCHIDVTTMSRSLDRLQSLGYLSRERDPDCRRSYLICLTSSGRQAAETIRRLFHQVDQQLREGLTESELRLFFHCLEIVCENMEKTGTIL